MEKFKVVFENEDLFIIDKSAGITVNRSDTTSRKVTLQDLIDEYIQKIQNDSDVEFRNRSGIVHRLDKETSGLLIVAKNSEAFRNLQAQFKEKKVKKIYVALVHKEVKPEKGEINVPVGRLPWNRKRFGVLAGGRPAQTVYETVAVYKNPKTDETLTLLRLFPKTGRTHQIRVHLKYINHPIFSDYLYAGRKISREDRKELDRVFLHASEISFTDPITADLLSFKSDLPEELIKLLDKFEPINK